MKYYDIFIRLFLLATLPANLFAQGLQLLTPSGGESFQAGEQVAITWNSSDAIDAINLYFSFNQSTWYSMASGQPNSGSYQWIVPYFKKAKPQVWIKIAASNVNLSDSSDAPFSVAAALPDKAEPNDSRATAALLALGDTLHGLIAMGYGGTDMSFMKNDTTVAAYADSDFFAVIVPAAKLLRVRTLPEFGGNRYNDQSTLGKVPIMYFMDSTGAVLARNSSSMYTDTFSVAIEKAGTYYCAVVPGMMPHEVAWYHKYGITARVEDLSSLSLQSPAGASAFQGGDTVIVKWSGAGTQIAAINLYFSFNQSVWHSIASGQPNSGLYQWIVPYFKKAKPQVWIKIAASNVNLSDSFVAPFSITAAIPDKAEPNDNRATAALLALGDTLHGLIAMGYGGTDIPFMKNDTMVATYADSDFFAVTVPAAKLLRVRTLPEFGNNKYNDQSMMGKVPVIYFMDSTGAVLARNSSSNFTDILSVAVIKAGTYYCGIVPGMMPHEAAWYHKYSITTRIVADLEIMNIGPSNYVAKNDKYLLQLTGQSNDVSLSIIAKDKADGTITLASIPADTGVIPLPHDAIPVSIVSIEASADIASAMDSVTIGLGYADSLLKGNDKNNVTVMWHNDSLGEWQNIPSTPDTQDNKLIVSSSHFSVYGLFLRTSASAKDDNVHKGTPIIPGVKIFNSRHSIGAKFTVNRPGAIKFSIYTIDGRLIASALGRADMKQGEMMLTLPMTMIATYGVYVLRMEAPGIWQSTVVSVHR